MAVFHMISHPPVGLPRLAFVVKQVPGERAESSRFLEAWAQNWDSVTSTAFCWPKEVQVQLKFKEWRNISIYIYLKIFFIWERESRREGEKETEAYSMLSTEPGQGLDPQDPEIMTLVETKSQTLNGLSHLGAPGLHLLREELECFCNSFSTHAKKITKPN